MATTRLVLTDTNVLLNLAFVDRLDLLGTFPDLRFNTPREVVEELLSPRERALVELALGRGDLQEVVLADPEALLLFTDFLQVMGRGEAACLALAIRLGAWIASDEKRVFRREAERHLGPGSILNTPGLMVLAIRRGVIGIEEADDMKRVLEGRRFKMSFDSFARVLVAE